MKRAMVCFLMCLLAVGMLFSAGQKAIQEKEPVVLTIWEHTPQFELPLRNTLEIGRASCRERVCLYV